MAFQLNHVVPWGRNFAEYCLMFQLGEPDRSKKIAGFGDGPASFNAEATRNGFTVTSFDPIYQFTAEQIASRIEETRITVMDQMKENQDRYVWKSIRSLAELEAVRMSAMKAFLADYDDGRAAGRYIYHELPSPVPADENEYDIGLSSHFLLMYTILGYEFQVQAITEMLRVCKEVQIFPILDLGGDESSLITDVIKYFEADYQVGICETGYEFQKGGNRLLIIKK